MSIKMQQKCWPFLDPVIGGAGGGGGGKKIYTHG